MLYGLADAAGALYALGVTGAAGVVGAGVVGAGVGVFPRVYVVAIAGVAAALTGACGFGTLIPKYCATRLTSSGFDGGLGAVRVRFGGSPLREG